MDEGVLVADRESSSGPSRILRTDLGVDRRNDSAAWRCRAETGG